MADTRYVSTKFEMRANIGGTDFTDIVAISATFGLNSIPTASLTVAVGRDTRTDKKATIHTLRKKIKARDPVKVWLKLTDPIGQKDKTESGPEFVIFDGMVAGIGYQRSHNSANYVLQLVHWLDDLNNSSMINGKWFQNAPYVLATNAAFKALQLTEGDSWGPIPGFDSNNAIVSAENIQTDFWGKVLKPMFQTIGGWATLSAAGRINNAAEAALDRIIEGPENERLRLDISGLPPVHIQRAIRNALVKDAQSSFAFTSFWGKLVGEYAPQFFFAVSPGIEEARVIPFFGGLQYSDATPHVISGDDYSYANFNASIQQLIDSVCLFWPQSLVPETTSGGTLPGSVNLYLQPVGEYPKDATRPGLKLFKELPTWLAQLTAQDAWAATNTAQPQGDTSSGLVPATNTPENYRPVQALLSAANSAGDRFAEHFYKTEFLSQRYGELSGKLRFDIAPGSIVKIELPQSEIDSDGAMIGAVTQVSYAINAERALAGTSFALSYLRTETEDKDTTLVSQTYAPLYVKNTKFAGGPLRKK